MFYSSREYGSSAKDRAVALLELDTDAGESAGVTFGSSGACGYRRFMEDASVNLVDLMSVGTPVVDRSERTTSSSSSVALASEAKDFATAEQPEEEGEVVSSTPSNASGEIRPAPPAEFSPDRLFLGMKQARNSADLPVGFFGLYDGHCGAEAAKFTAEHLPECLIEMERLRLRRYEKMHIPVAADLRVHEGDESRIRVRLFENPNFAPIRVSLKASDDGDRILVSLRYALADDRPSEYSCSVPAAAPAVPCVMGDRLQAHSSSIRHREPFASDAWLRGAHVLLDRRLRAYSAKQAASGKECGRLYGVTLSSAGTTACSMIVVPEVTSSVGSLVSPPELSNVECELVSMLRETCNEKASEEWLLPDGGVDLKRDQRYSSILRMLRGREEVVQTFSGLVSGLKRRIEKDRAGGKSVEVEEARLRKLEEESVKYQASLARSRRELLEREEIVMKRCRPLVEKRKALLLIPKRFVVMPRAIDLICCNVGDSRAVLSCCGKIYNLSRNHKPTPESFEGKRIALAGGCECVDDGGWRVCPKGESETSVTLAMSRCFGDFHLKDPDSKLPVQYHGVTSVPEIKRIRLEMQTDTGRWRVRGDLSSQCVSGEPTDFTFAVIACDGLWDMYRSDVPVIDEVEKRLRVLAKGTASYYESRKKEFPKPEHIRRPSAAFRAYQRRVSPMARFQSAAEERAAMFNFGSVYDDDLKRYVCYRNSWEQIVSDRRTECGVYPMDLFAEDLVMLGVSRSTVSIADNVTVTVILFHNE